MDTTRQAIRRMLHEARRPRSYTDIGHRLAVLKDFDAWKWTDGEFTFASKEGVPADKFHLDVFGEEGPPQFAGRIDHEKRMASLTPWAFDPRMAERKATHVAKQLAKHLPDDYEFWYFPHGQTSEGEPGSRIL